MAACLLGLSCDGGNPAQFTLVYGEIAHVEDCHLEMSNSAYDKDPPWIGLKYVCGSPESDLKGFPKDDPRWATHPTPPLGYTMAIHDCLLLNETFYCVESVKQGKASFKATFKQPRGRGPIITHIRP